MDEQDNKIDWFGPQIILAFVAAFIGDFTFILFVTHFLCGIIMIAAIGSKTRGVLAKLVLGLAFIIPGPTLVIGLVLALILSNKALAIIAEQAGIQLIALGTGGLGEGLEAVALTEEGTELAVAGAEAVEAAEAAGAVAEGAETAAGTVEAGEAAEEGEETVSQKLKRRLQEKAQDQLSGGGGRDEDEDEDQEGEQGISDDQRREIESQVDYEQAVAAGTQLSPIEEAEQKDFALRQSAPQPPKPDAKLSKANLIQGGFAERQKKTQELNRQAQIENLRKPQITEVDPADGSDKENDIRRAA